MKNFLWNNESLQAACPQASVHKNCHGNRISINTRDVVEGDIFVAFKGEKVDGHDYVSDAFSKGASCAIVERRPEGLESDEGLMIVSNTKQAMQDLAVFNRNRSKAKIVAVTGSVGKTSTKEALQLACAVHKKTFCSKKNFNNDLGLPMNLASMPLDTEIGVFELGMNHKGEIEELTKMVKPHISIITKVAKVHIEFLGSLRNIALAKGEIFLGMNEDGKAIFNGDDEYSDVLHELASKQGMTDITQFGEDKSNDSYLMEYEARAGRGARVKAKILQEEVEYELQANGKHHAVNSIAVLSAINKLGLNVEQSAQALGSFKNIAGRGEVLEMQIGNKKVFVIDDSYNANPTSTEAALTTVLGNFARRVAVLGDMVELGEYSKEGHESLAAPFEASGIDKLITVGPFMEGMYKLVSEEKRLAQFNDYQSAREKILDLIQDGDCILFKGSNGTKIHEIVKHLKKQTA